MRHPLDQHPATHGIEEPEKDPYAVRVIEEVTLKSPRARIYLAGKLARRTAHLVSVDQGIATAEVLANNGTTWNWWKDAPEHKIRERLRTMGPSLLMHLDNLERLARADAHEDAHGQSQ